MMCPMCKKAGMYNNLGDFNGAAHYHDNCQYPVTCTCQHSTGDHWINHERLEEPK